MTNKSNKASSLIELLLAWGIIPLAYLSWCFSTVAYNGVIFSVLSAVVGVVSALLYGAIGYSKIRKQYRRIDELNICNWILLISGVLVSAVIWKQFEGIACICAYAVVLVWSVISAVLLCKSGFGLKKSADVSVRNWLVERSYLIILIVAVILVGIDNPIQFKWDGLLYYSAVEGANISSISSVALYGHIAMFVGAVMKIFALLCGSTAIGMYVANMVFLLVSTLAFYGIVKTILPKRKEIEYVLAAAVYAFSPYLSGMVGYYSLDYYVICVTTILLYCIFNKKWILTTVAACAYCLSKEPDLISYGGLCLGLVLYDFISIKGSVKDKATAILSSAHYYFMLIPIVLWLVTYKILGGWSAGNGGFGIDLQYICQKLMVFMVFNWSWIFTIAAIVFVIALIVRHDQNHTWWILPLVCSNIFLLLFNCMFKTVNHPRYIDSFVVINYCLAIIGIMYVVSNVPARRVVLSVAMLVQILACYLTFDPITLQFWDCSNVGHSKLATTYSHFSGDGVIYNKQILWMEEALCNAMEDALNEGSQVVFVAGDGATNIFDGMSEYSSQEENVICEDEYWDKQEKARVNPFDEHINDTEVEKISVLHIRADRPIDISDIGDTVSVIYIKGINDYTKPTNMQMVDSLDYSNRGWTVTRDIYTKD